MDLQLSVVLDEPKLPEFIQKKLTLERVVPIISANVACVISGITVSGFPSLPKLASNKRIRAKRFSLELKS
jgi:hypothetical protein